MKKPHEHDGWSDEDQREFWAAIKRARGHKLDRLRRKAYLLVRSGDDSKLEAALEFVPPFVDAYVKNLDGIRDKQKYPVAYKGQVVDLATFMARTLHGVGRFEEAFTWARTMFEIYIDDYSRTSIPETEMYLFAEIAASKCSLRDAEHVLAMVEALQDREYPSWSDFSQAARLWDRLGHHEMANSKWQNAWSGVDDWLPYREYRKLIVLDPGGEPYTDPDYAAEGIVVNHHSVTEKVFTADRDALAELDRLLGPDGPKSHRADSYQFYYQQQTLAPELGAFVGRVLVTSAGGEWVVGEPLANSSIKLRGVEIDPFKAAFERVFFERSLVRFYDQVVSE